MKERPVRQRRHRRQQSQLKRLMMNQCVGLSTCLFVSLPICCVVALTMDRPTPTRDVLGWSLLSHHENNIKRRPIDANVVGMEPLCRYDEDTTGNRLKLPLSQRKDYSSSSPFLIKSATTISSAIDQSRWSTKQQQDADPITTTTMWLDPSNGLSHLMRSIPRSHAPWLPPSQRHFNNKKIKNINNNKLGFDDIVLQAAVTQVDVEQWNVPKPMQQQELHHHAGNSIWSTKQSTISWLDGRSQEVNVDDNGDVLIPLQESWLESTSLRALQQACLDRKLAKRGTKADLRARLRQYQKNSQESEYMLPNLSRSRAHQLADRPPRLERSSNDTATALAISLLSVSAPTNTTATLQANSLAEWARTVDLEPLLSRRESILHNKNATSSAKLRIMVADDADNVSTNLYLAAKHADQAGDRSVAQRLLLELLHESPSKDARIYSRLARFYKEEDNLDQARQILKQGLLLFPNNGYLWHALAQMAPTSTVAKGYWQTAMRVDPKFPHPYHSLGTHEHTHGRIASAMQILQNGLQHCPTNHRLWHALGDLYLDAKLLDRAEASYRKAIQHGPMVSHGFGYTGLACVSYEEGKMLRARHFLRQAILSNEGRHVNGWIKLAQMEEVLGNVDKARAACMAGLTQYERGLVEKHQRVRLPPLSAAELLEESAETIQRRMLTNVPVYRSGDRFYQLYRQWAKLEERHGSRAAVENVYKRANVAFPREHKLTLDWAMYYVKLELDDHAREKFERACAQVRGRHGDPYRLHAQFEMSRGNYKAARQVLYDGAQMLSRLAPDGDTTHACGLAELYRTWAICEWHLNELTRAEVLLDHALRMTSAGQDGSKLRSCILYSIARLENYRGEYVLAQHCIGLCLKEDLLPGGNAQIWELWARVAMKLGNNSLARQCDTQAKKSKINERESGVSLLSHNTEALTRMKEADMNKLMRRDPWASKYFGNEHARKGILDSVRWPDEVDFGASANVPQLVSFQEPLQ